MIEMLMGVDMKAGFCPVVFYSGISSKFIALPCGKNKFTVEIF
jgi:hypothetical protein